MKRAKAPLGMLVKSRKFKFKSLPRQPHFKTLFYFHFVFTYNKIKEQFINPLNLNLYSRLYSGNAEFEINDLIKHIK